ncbi:hypothetical protein Rsub_02527 [Raphidocelis subcapitata]|uniref:Uncharacterized protein n=1 Tax=Raphidocelis subcapitata TaxID=307507 RepID=A0A2V0NW89_9CHLO|nr:hypothetical protein Rsub_02527 [Raphidocelis subcapitata]|eukprot:GBF89823.1 hypothetical protein Rsub_02527 [Raphidocelis subcapitata]
MLSLGRTTMPALAAPTAPLAARPANAPATARCCRAAAVRARARAPPPAALARCSGSAAPRWSPELAEEHLVLSNMRALQALGRRTGEEGALDSLLEERPLLLQLQVENWLQFLGAYGVKDCDIVKLLVTCPELFERSNVHSAGLVILAFKQLGWRDVHIANRLVPLYPRLLANSIDLDMQPVVNELEAAGCKGDQLRLIAWEVPRIFSRHTFRRYLRQFQALGVYGLSREGAVSSRAVAATMMLHPFG